MSDRAKVAAHPRRFSPTRREVARRRIAEGKDVLRRKSRKESPEHFFVRILNEAFGDMDRREVARLLGLSPMRHAGSEASNE